mmetsp:Transcript_18248/g.33750  ORF Transcript_18248/g.33750 Transcript_18248/m.33750 type:complete len:290 (-) Transcript_18248:48-917(-)
MVSSSFDGSGLSPTWVLTAVMGWLELAVLIVQAVIRPSAVFGVAQGFRQSRRPEQVLELYEFHGCPFCLRVRETIAVLGLDVKVYPCPKTTLSRGTSEGSRYRGKVKELGGKVQFPLLVDRNNDVVMHESEEIVKYLWKTYGDKAVEPKSYTRYNSIYLGWTKALSLIIRANHGFMRVPSNEPEEPLVLWGFVGSPFVAKVQEKLCEMEIPYLFRNVSKGHSPARREFMSKFGDMVPSWRKDLKLIQIPLLEDPNTGTTMLESADICNYLDSTYGIQKRKSLRKSLHNS